ncbi:MAG: phosphate signaling complex protein PhoU [Chloroflexi bacterium]|jgi:phosphate transport system protein|nr:phosphate signaling complex protein PhoU [Chloroflexota bacterium]
MQAKPRETLDRELQSLKDEVLKLGSMVEDALITSVDLLKQRDMEGSKRLIEHDKRINELRFAIEDHAMTVIALHQPMARDARILGAMMEISTELERIGDYAKGIAKVNCLIGDQPLLKPLIDVPQMAEKARSMLHRALDAFVRLDTEAAYEIPKSDDEVDGLYDQVYRELMTYILADPSCLEQANYLLWVAHNLERAADRVANVCERIIYTATGELTELT